MTRLLVVIMVLASVGSGCFGLFHELAGDHETARKLFWAETAAFGATTAGLAGILARQPDGPFDASYDVIVGATVASGVVWGVCFYYDIFHAPVAYSRRRYATHNWQGVITPTGAALVCRF